VLHVRSQRAGLHTDDADDCDDNDDDDDNEFGLSVVICIILYRNDDDDATASAYGLLADP